jgi:hypothetical protein
VTDSFVERARRSWIEVLRRVERGWIRDGMFVMNVWMSGERRERTSVASWSVRVPWGVER